MALDPRPALSEAKDGVRLRLRVQPRARQSELAGMHGDALKLRIQAPPVDGKANAAIEAFLGECLGIPRGSVEVVAGASGRDKSVRVQGLTLEQVAARLADSAS